MPYTPQGGTEKSTPQVSDRLRGGIELNPGLPSRLPGLKNHQLSMAILKNCPSLFLLRNKQAFTLLEVMIAVSIIAIALVALFGSQSRSLSHATEAHFNVIATMLASGKLAELEAEDDAPNNDDGDFGDEFPGYSWTIETEDANFDSPEALADLEESLQKVELTVLWNETKFRYSLTYYGRW